MEHRHLTTESVLSSIVAGKSVEIDVKLFQDLILKIEEAGIKIALTTERLGSGIVKVSMIENS